MRSLGDHDAAPPLLRRALPALFLLAVAFLSRGHVIGNPVIQIDDQWYLLVGGRLLHGAIPFVDIFDRKPIGLFVIFAAVRAFGGDGVVGYQLLALVCAWLTSLVVHRMARAVSSPGGALAAGALYLLGLTVAGGEGGQSPVFYNLPVAVAALLVWRASRSSPTTGSLRASGAAVMLLVGLAMQIKYNAVFEGIFFGLVLLATEWTQRRNLGALALSAASWIAVAAAPTLAAAAVYWWIGHLPEWIFANVTSILNRSAETHATQVERVKEMTAMLGPILLAVPLRRWLGARPEQPDAREDLRFLDLWAASALLGVVVFGTWYDHYALPLFAPLAVVASPLATRRLGGLYLVALLCAAGVRGQALMRQHDRTRGDAASFERLVAASGPFTGCPFVYEALPAFYDRTGACLPTTRAFPGHLNQRNEEGATGIDEAAEVARIMATRPPRVIAIVPAIPEENPVARAALDRGLRDYHVVFRLLLKRAKPKRRIKRSHPPIWLVVFAPSR